MGKTVANMSLIHGMHTLDKGFMTVQVVKIMRKFEDYIYENKIHGSRKNGNRFLLHY